MTATSERGDDERESSDPPVSDELRVPEMDCPSCAGTVEGALADVDGLDGFETNPTTGTITLAYDGAADTRQRVVDAVERAGYAVEDDDDAGVADPTAVWRTPRALKTWASGTLVVGALLTVFVVPWNPEVISAFGRPYPVSDLLLLGAIAVGGQVILGNGLTSVRNRSLDIDFLMSVAILGATGVTVFAGRHLFVEAASLAVLFNVAELLETYSVTQARSSLDELLSLTPETAMVRRDGDTVEVPASEVREGERVVVQPGGKIPVDGVVVEGESAVDQSPVTGESVPVDKRVDDEVYAGTITKSGYLEIEATADGDDNTISRVIDLVEQAQKRQTSHEQFVDRFASYYTPTVVAAAVLTAAVPPLVFGAPAVEWFVRAIAFLVIACPCAFVISTPVTVVSGLTSAARNGVLIKGGDYLEAMGGVETVAFDKTGTLTTGDLEVTDVLALNGNSEADVLRCARGIESRSEHPIADAIVEEATAGATPAGGVPAERREVTDFEALAGRGVRADLGGETHYAGKPGLFADLGFDLGHVHFTTGAGDLSGEAKDMCQRDGCLDLVEDTIPRLQSEGKTVVVVGSDDEVEGLIAVADAVRPEAKATVQALRDQGVHTVMMTGDNEGTARAVGEQVGIDEVHAELLPAEKVDRLEALMDDHDGVAMVGDGINDAPALATATVGIAMGAAGSDTAIETSDVALLGDDLSKLPYLSRLASRATGVIKQNIWGSLGVKALLALGIPFGIVGVVHAVLIGDVGMTTAITGNAMRLSRLSPPDLLAGDDSG